MALTIRSYSKIRTAPGVEKKITINYTATGIVSGATQLIFNCYVSLSAITGGASTGTVDIGTMTLNGSFSTSRSGSVSIAITPPESLADEFAKASARGVPIHVSLRARKVSGGTTSESFPGSAELSEAFVLDKLHLPVIETFEVERATSTGTPSDEGVYLLSSMKLGCEDTSGMNLKLHYAQDGMADTSSPYIDLTGKIPDLLTGVTDSISLITQNFTNGSDFNFLLVFGDDYESASVKRSIFEAFANLHLSGCKTGGVCVGGFGTSEVGKPKFESRYRFYPYAGIEGVNIYKSGEIKTGGLWIDNKPIYRFIVAAPFTRAATETTIGTVPEDIETIIACSSTIMQSDGTFRPMAFVAAGSTLAQWGAAIYVNASREIRVETGKGFENASYVVANFEYTKASDAPVGDFEGYAQLIDVNDYIVIDKNGYRILVKE